MLPNRSIGRMDHLTMGKTPKPYGYRDDRTVPRFRDDKPIIVFDGHCALCSGWVRFVIRHDPKRLFRFVPAQSALGAALYRHYGLDDKDFETNILIEDGLPRFRMDGSIRMATLLGAPWSMAESLRAFPEGIQRRLYDLVARNRLRLFGRLEACHMPDPADRDRFLA